MLVRHPHAERGNDLYETPAGSRPRLWRSREPAAPALGPGCGPRHIVDPLRAAATKFSARPRRLRPAGLFRERDFLLERKAPDGCAGIVTNPPYRLAAEFVAHAIALAPSSSCCSAPHLPRRRHRPAKEAPAAALRARRGSARAGARFRRQIAGDASRRLGRPARQQSDCFRVVRVGPRPCRSHDDRPHRLERSKSFAAVGAGGGQT